MALRTRGAAAMAAACASVTCSGVSTRTSAPAVNAAWSLAERSQLWCWASASVPVATASTTSSGGPACLTGRLLICQLAKAADSLRPRDASRSPPRAATGSTRSRTAVPAASARAGATASTGSTPRVPFTDGVAAEYLRSCQTVSTASATSARSAPALATPEITACRPRRTLTAGGDAGRSAGPSMIVIPRTAVAATAHHAPAVIPDSRRPAARSGPAPASTAASQQPCRHREGPRREQEQLQRPDGKQRAGYAQVGRHAAEQRGQAGGYRQAAKRRRVLQVLLLLRDASRERAKIGTRDVRGVGQHDPRGSVDNEGMAEGRGVHDERAVGGEPADRADAARADGVELPVLRRVPGQIPRAEYAGQPYPHRPVVDAVAQREDVPGRQPQQPRGGRGYRGRNGLPWPRCPWPAA